MLGCRVYSIPHNFDVCETAENALAYVPQFDPPVAGVWVGFITSEQRYADLYRAAAAKGVYLLNDPKQHETVMSFDGYYSLIEGLTPRSRIVNTIEESLQAADQIGYPVFVRGAVKSNKVNGWDACVAKSAEELTPITEALLKYDYRSRGKVVIRELAPLRRTGEPSFGFPITREYRAFLYRGEILAYSFYWDEYKDPLGGLSAVDTAKVEALMRDASKRTAVPFMTVDVGQLDNGEWTIIELGDPQCAGLSHVPVLELWSKIKDITLRDQD